MPNLPISINDKIKAELSELEGETVYFDNAKLRPSQCYHFDTDPVHLLFNTNCPNELKEKILGIVKKYIPSYQSSASQ